MSYQRSLLSNGIRVVTEELSNVQSVTIGLWVNTGSRQESLSEQGISHFLEHMNFKGTRRRSILDIARFADSVGGNLNAFTSRENTCFSARVLAEHLNMAVDLLCDIVFNSVYELQEINREKAVIAEEICMYEDSPEDLIHDLHIQHCWPEHPLGYSTLGTSETLASFTQESLITYFNQQYTPQRIVITAAGKVNHQLLTEELEKHLGNYHQDKYPVKNFPPKAKGGKYFHEKQLEQIHFCLGTQGVNRSHSDYFGFILLNIILGGGMSSRLFQRVREREALAYSIFSYLSPYLDAGLFTVYAGVGKGKLLKTVDIILDEFAQIKKTPVTPDELKQAQEQFKGAFLLSLESTENHMGRLAKLELYHDRYFSAEEVIAQVEKVTPSQIQALANEYFTNESLTLTCLGNLPASKAIELTC